MLKNLSNHYSVKALGGASDLACPQAVRLSGVTFHSPRHSCVDFIPSMWFPQSQLFCLDQIFPS